MSKRFYAVNRTTGEQWEPDNKFDRNQYLVMYTSGYAAVVTEDFYTSIEPLDRSIWEVVIKGLGK
jgi:hypothetical protein